MRAFIHTLILLLVSSTTLSLSAQIQASAAADSLILTSSFSSAEIMQAEAQFLESIVAQTEQLTQLRDSLTELLEAADEAAPNREEMQNMLDMYNSMLRTNDMILEGKARIVGVLK